MLLIDNDYAGIFDGGENRTSRSDDDAGVPGVDFVPFVVALAIGEMAMQNRNPVLNVGEAGFESFHRLGGEGDFRNEDESCFSSIQGVPDGAKVDFGFSRTGNAEKQNGPGGIRHFLDHCTHGFFLLGV